MVEKGKVRIADQLQAVEFRYRQWLNRNEGTADTRLIATYQPVSNTWKLSFSGLEFEGRDIDDLIEEAFPHKEYK